MIDSKKIAFVVVDSKDERENYKIPLERDGFIVELFESEGPALAALKDVSPDVAIVHFGQDMSRTVEFIRQAHLLDPTVCIVYFTYYTGKELHAEAVKAGAYAVLTKPASIYDAEFIEFLRAALKESKKNIRSALGKHQALVLMPFATEFNDLYRAVKEAFEELGYDCRRMDELQYVGDVVTKLYEKLEESEFIIADITGNNPNVFYEMGYADALEKTVVILKHHSSEAPFNVRVRRLVVYDDITQLKESLIAMVRGLTTS